MRFKRTLLKAAHKVGVFRPFHWANRDKILVLTYHRFSRGKEYGKVSAEEFSLHLEYLKRNSHVISLSDALLGLANKKKLPPNATVITIDDGYLDAFQIAFPILRRFELPATLFAVTDFLDGKCWLWTDVMRYALQSTDRNPSDLELADGTRIRASLVHGDTRVEFANRVNSSLKQLPNEKKQLQIRKFTDLLGVEVPERPTEQYAPISWDQAREMDEHDLKIESHTKTHPILTNVSQADVDYELQSSKQRLETELGRTIEHFCFPNGVFNAQVKKAVERARYKSAVTTAYGFNDGNADLFALKRIDGHSSIENFAQSASGFEAVRNRIL